MFEKQKCDCIPTFVPTIYTEVRTFQTVCAHGMSQPVVPEQMFGYRQMGALFVQYVVSCWTEPGEMMEDSEIRSSDHIEVYLCNWGDPDEFAIYRAEEGVLGGDHTLRFARCNANSQYALEPDGTPVESWAFHGHVEVGEWAMMSMLARGLGEDLTTMVMRASKFGSDTES